MNRSSVETETDGGVGAADSSGGREALAQRELAETETAARCESDGRLAECSAGTVPRRAKNAGEGAAVEGAGGPTSLSVTRVAALSGR